LLLKYLFRNFYFKKKCFSISIFAYVKIEFFRHTLPTQLTQPTLDIKRSRCKNWKVTTMFVGKIKETFFPPSSLFYTPSSNVTPYFWMNTEFYIFLLWLIWCRENFKTYLCIGRHWHTDFQFVLTGVNELLSYIFREYYSVLCNKDDEKFL
jgi:hypothetical protein